jgi:TetR/AcrR family transcriptional repressor of nem operon
MARPREFNHDQVLDAAMATFWAKGYEATSLADLTRAMGLSKSSFYEAFGSKHELFLKVIDRYGETVVAPRLRLLETGNWAGGTIAVLFERIIKEVLAEDPRRGCLAGNGASELLPGDTVVAPHINACLMRYEDAFHGVLVRARERGEFPPERDLRAMARFLAACLQGLYVMAQAGAGRDALNDIAGGALASLASLA